MRFYMFVCIQAIWKLVDVYFLTFAAISAGMTN